MLIHLWQSLHFQPVARTCLAEPLLLTRCQVLFCRRCWTDALCVLPWRMQWAFSASAAQGCWVLYLVLTLMGPDSGSLILNPSEKQTVCSFQLGSAWTSLAPLTRLCPEEVADKQTRKITVRHYGATVIQPCEFYTKLELNSSIKPLRLPWCFWFSLIYFPFLPSRFPLVFRTGLRVNHGMHSPVWGSLVSEVGGVDWPHSFRADMWACVHRGGWKL